MPWWGDVIVGVVSFGAFVSLVILVIVVTGFVSMWRDR